MNKILLAFFLLAGLTCYAEADNTELQRVNNKVIQLSQTVEDLTKENQQLKNNVTDLQRGTTALQDQIGALEAKSDSIDNVLMSGVSSNTARQQQPCGGN